MQKMSDKPLTQCPTCRRKVTKLISSTTFQLKGSGWYITDYARKGESSGGAKGDKKGDDKKSDDKKSDSKNASTSSDSGSASDGGSSDAASKTSDKGASKKSEKAAVA
jgi:predicted nucleic acid-binding Zn ribbon protein